MKQSFSIPEIHCASCVFLLETLEEDYRGVENVKVDLGRRIAQIDFDEDSISADEIIKAIKKVSGYKAVVNAT